MLNFIQFQRQIREKLSLAKTAILNNNGTLSQKYLAVSHTAKLGFFVAPITGQTRHFSNHNASIGKMVGLSIMVWLIPQNKPFGKYGERLLDMPRVRPHHPNLGLFTQNYLGAFQC